MRQDRISTVCSTALAAVAALGLAACDVSVPDLNNPPLEELEDNPTRTTISSACTGLLIGTRAGTGAANGYIMQLGILGREAYNFDPADPRYVGELLEGRLSPASPFGGAFWANPYTNMRLGDIIVRGVDRVEDFSNEERNAIRGYVRTIRALDLLRVTTTRYDIGAVIFTDHPPEELAPIVSLEEALAETARVLDEGHAELLNAGGGGFPFALSEGFEDFDFDTVDTFAQFNRALRVKIAIYQEEYETAVELLDVPATVGTGENLRPNPEGTFLGTDIEGVEDLRVGVYHSFSTGTGDLPNALVNINIYAHPSVTADAEPGDQRLATKVEEAEEPGGVRGLSSDRSFTLYTDPDSPVPIIRNEELILFRAEARWFTDDEAGATADLNLIRATSAGLPAIPTPADDEAFIDALLYERRYSLLFEGHRMIDLRRFGLLDDLPRDQSTEKEPIPHHINYRWPLPQAECDARPGEERCGVETQWDPAPEA